MKYVIFFSGNFLNIFSPFRYGVNNDDIILTGLYAILIQNQIQKLPTQKSEIRQLRDLFLNLQLRCLRAIRLMINLMTYGFVVWG